MFPGSETAENPSHSHSSHIATASVHLAIFRDQLRVKLSLINYFIYLRTTGPTLTGISLT